MANVLKRPSTVIDPYGSDADALFQQFLDALSSEVTLNVAGPRESGAPGVYRAVSDVLIRNVERFRAA